MFQYFQNIEIYNIMKHHAIWIINYTHMYSYEYHKNEKPYKTDVEGNYVLTSKYLQWMSDKTGTQILLSCYVIGMASLDWALLGKQFSFFHTIIYIIEILWIIYVSRMYYHRDKLNYGETITRVDPNMRFITHYWLYILIIFGYINTGIHMAAYDSKSYKVFHKLYGMHTNAFTPISIFITYVGRGLYFVM